MRLLMDKSAQKEVKKQETQHIDCIVTDLDSIPLAEPVLMHPLPSILEKDVIAIGYTTDIEQKVDINDLEFYDPRHFQGVLLEDYDLDNGKLERVASWLSGAQQTLQKLWICHELQTWTHPTSTTDLITSLYQRGLCFPCLHTLELLGGDSGVGGGDVGFFRHLHEVFPGLQDLTVVGNAVLRALPNELAPLLVRLRLVDCVQLRAAPFADFLKRATMLRSLTIDKDTLPPGQLKPMTLTGSEAIQQAAEQLRKEQTDTPLAPTWPAPPFDTEDDFWHDVPFVIYHRVHGTWLQC